MSTSRNPTAPSSATTKPTAPHDDRIIYSKEEWMRLSPFLTEEEAQGLVDNPPLAIKPEDAEDHSVMW